MSTKSTKPTWNDVKAPASEKVKKVVAESLQESGYSNLAEMVNNAPNWQQAVTNLSANVPQEALNSMVGNLYGFIAKQVIAAQSADDIFGNLFKEGEPLNAGEGLNYVEVILNGVGTNEIVNYQTSTESTGAIALGESFTNSNQLQILYKWLPAQQIKNVGWTSTVNVLQTDGMVKPITLTFNTSFAKTFNKTVPVIWAQFSTLSAIQVEQLLNDYYQDVENAVKLYKYQLGNLILSDALLPNRVIHAPQMNGPQSIYDYLQKFIFPTLLKMRQITADYNAADVTPQAGQWAQPDAWPSNFYNSVVVPNMSGYTGSVLNNGNKTNLKIIMNPNVAAAVASVLNLPAFGDVLDIKIKNGVVVEMLGIPVHVTGSLINITPQAPQGTAITPNLNQPSVQLLDDWTIVVIDEDLLTWTPVFENTYTSDVYGNAMIKTIRKQIAYLPVYKPWKNGVIFKSFSEGGNPIRTNSFVYSDAKLPVKQWY